MTKTKKAHITVTVDRQGSIEVHGLEHGDLDAPRIAEELGLPSYYHLGLMHTGLRTDGLDRSVIEKAQAAALAHGYEVSEVDELPLAHSTGSGGHEHDDDKTTADAIHTMPHGPSKKEKAVYPFIVLAVLLSVGGIGMLIRDHLVHDYRPLANLAQLAPARAALPAASAGFAAFINPDDRSFVEVEVRGWSYWKGTSAIAQDCYVRIPDLPTSIEEFVTAEGSAATVRLRFDLARGEGATYHVDAIHRGGMDVGTGDLGVEVYPLDVGDLPDADAHVEAADIRYDTDRTFRDLERFQVRGFVQRADDGFRIVAREYAVSLAAPADPGLRLLLEDLAVTDAEIAAADPKTRAGIEIYGKRVTAFVTMDTLFAWTEGGKPGRRQTTREVGRVMLDGVKLGKVMVRGS